MLHNWQLPEVNIPVITFLYFSACFLQREEIPKLNFKLSNLMPNRFYPFSKRKISIRPCTLSNLKPYLNRTSYHSAITLYVLLNVVVVSILHRMYPVSRFQLIAPPEKNIHPVEEYRRLVRDPERRTIHYG